MDFNLIFVIVYVSISLFSLIVSLVLIIHTEYYWKSSRFHRFITLLLKKEYTQRAELKKHGFILLSFSLVVFLCALEIHLHYSVFPKKIDRIIEAIEKGENKP